MHTFTKLILTGDSGAGKTTTAKHLVHLANIASSDVPVDCVANVERYTVKDPVTISLVGSELLVCTGKATPVHSDANGCYSFNIWSILTTILLAKYTVVQAHGSTWPGLVNRHCTNVHDDAWLYKLPAKVNHCPA